MGFFSKKLPIQDFTVEFGSEYLSTLTSIVSGTQQKEFQLGNISIHIPDQLLSDIDESISNHKPIGDVLYSDEKQFLEVVGESFHSEGIQELVDAIGTESWTSGTLLPEPFNQFDQNAVAVVLFYGSSKVEFKTVKVGYLAKDQAKKVQKNILKQLNMGAAIPVLAMVKGGTLEKSHHGILARAMTKKVTF